MFKIGGKHVAHVRNSRLSKLIKLSDRGWLASGLCHSIGILSNLCLQTQSIIDLFVACDGAEHIVEILYLNWFLLIWIRDLWNFVLQFDELLLNEVWRFILHLSAIITIKPQIFLTIYLHDLMLLNALILVLISELLLIALMFVLGVVLKTLVLTELVLSHCLWKLSEFN